MKKLGVFIATFLTIVLALSSIPNVYAPFNPPQLNLLPEEIYTHVSSHFDVVVQIEVDPQAPIVGFVFTLYFDPDSMEYATHTINNASTGWNVVVVLDDVGIGEIDIYTASQINDPAVPTTRDWVTITFHCLEKGDSLITMFGTIDFQAGAAPEPIQAIDSADVHQGSPVGGVFYSADKMNLISPWIAAISIIGCIAIVSIIVKKRRA
ncbi:MAG: hypothetical protein NWE86_07940 [Candidatus Bathyarchaeota archaeon]|nr:hypothetical protein [Candidatus Bathyarchaeota archaeon]